MTCSPEQLAANRANSAKSCGPRTEEGKAISRQNGLKHGLTGEGVVVSEADAAAFKEMAAKYHADFRPRTPMGKFLIDRAALMTVRLNRCAQHEIAMIAIGQDPMTIDCSPEAVQVWKYEMAAERALHRSMKEFREVEGMNASSATATVSKGLASSLKSMEKLTGTTPAPAPRPAPVAPPVQNVTAKREFLFPKTTYLPDLADNFVPIAVGKKS